jgi:hypothetical protein
MPSSTDRDRGLRRVSHLTRWLAGAALVLTGLFSAAAAKALPGKTKSAGRVGQTSAPSQPSSPVDDNGDGQAGGGLTPPAQLPQPSAGAGSVVSGAS